MPAAAPRAVCRSLYADAPFCLFRSASAISAVSLRGVYMLLPATDILFIDWYGAARLPISLRHMVTRLYRYAQRWLPLYMRHDASPCRYC